MALFKRRSAVDPAQLEAMRSELAELRQQLGAAEDDRKIVDNRLASLDAAALALGERTSRVESASERVTELDLTARLADLHDQLRTVSARLDEATGGDEPDATTADPAEVTDVTTAVSTIDPEALAALDARVSDIAAQLAAVDSLTLQLNQLNVRVLGQADLNDQIGRVQQQLATSQTLVDRIDVLEAKVTDTSTAPSVDLQPLHDRIDELQHQLTEVRQAAPDLRHVYERLDALDARPSEPPTAPGVDDIVRRIAELEASVPEVASLDEIRARIDDVETSAKAAREHSELVGQRLGNVSTELANQLAELSGELDEVGSRQQPAAAAADGGETEEAISQLRATQIRLAGEQARYEIAFRQDLAALADQLRRAPRS
jgi:chromosome segregation ATPase